MYEVNCECSCLHLPYRPNQVHFSQTEHFLAVEFNLGYEKSMSFFVLWKSPKVWKKIEKLDCLVWKWHNLPLWIERSQTISKLVEMYSKNNFPHIFISNFSASLKSKKCRSFFFLQSSCFLLWFYQNQKFQNMKSKGPCDITHTSCKEKHIFGSLSNRFP